MSGRPDHPGSATRPADCILTFNVGSSSIRFALFDIGAGLARLAHGTVDRIGASGNAVLLGERAGRGRVSLRLPATDHASAAHALFDWLEQEHDFSSVRALGHRIVHGMQHSTPELVTADLLTELRGISPFAPEHLPREIALIEACQARHPALPQVACFDTAFHRDMPRVAKLLPIPWRHAADGVERYGFHGLSYAFLMEELARLDPDAARGRVILAHLGNGASLAAVRDGRSVDTSMGFTPTAGLVMGTRSGDLDPGVAFHLAHRGGLSAAQLYHLLNHESGLLGVSGSSADLRELCEREATDTRAADAVALFCYQARKWIGAFAAALGGLNTLVFTGGIGENSALIRARICADLGFLGIAIHAARNDGHAALISPASGHVAVRVMRTNEELMVARSVHHLLSPSPGTGAA